MRKTITILSIFISLSIISFSSSEAIAETKYYLNYEEVDVQDIIDFLKSFDTKIDALGKLRRGEWEKKEEFENRKFRMEQDLLRYTTRFSDQDYLRVVYTNIATVHRAREGVKIEFNRSLKPHPLWDPQSSQHSRGMVEFFSKEYFNDVMNYNCSNRQKNVCSWRTMYFDTSIEKGRKLKYIENKLAVEVVFDFSKPSKYCIEPRYHAGHKRNRKDVLWVSPELIRLFNNANGKTLALYSINAQHCSLCKEIYYNAIK